MDGMPSVSGLIDQAISLGGAAIINGVFGKKWGIFDQYGSPIFLTDSFIAMTYNAGASVSNFPVENGEFRSYNKTRNPSIASVTLAKSVGGVMKRGVFLAQLEARLKSTLSFYVVTPEYVYMNYQIIGINHSRSASEGATLIKVNLDLQEIVKAKIDYDLEEVENPSDSTTKDTGAKESTERPSSILNDIANGLFGK